MAFARDLGKVLAEHELVVPMGVSISIKCGVAWIGLAGGGGGDA